MRSSAHERMGGVRTRSLYLGMLGLAEFSRTALFFTLLPIYATADLRLSLALAGLAISSHYLADTLFRGPMGWLVDRVGTRPLMMLSFLLGIVAIFLIWHARSALSLVAASAFFGLTISPAWPSVVTGTTARATPENRATIMGMVFSAWLVGGGSGLLLLELLLGNSVRWSFLMLILAQVIGLVLAVLLRDGRPGARVEGVSWLEGISHVGRDIRAVRLLFPGMIVQNMALGLLVPVARIFAAQDLGVTSQQFALLIVGGGALTVLLLIPMGRAIDRFGTRRPLTVGFVLAALALFLLPQHRPFMEVLALGALLGASYAVILPAWNAFLAAAVPKERQGALWGVFMTVEGLGLAIGPALGGRLWESFGAPGPFWGAAFIFVAMGIFYGLDPVSRRVAQ